MQESRFPDWGQFEFVDLTYAYEEGMPVWPTHPHYFQNRWEHYENGFYFNQITLGEHNGTHIDAPGHFIQEGPAHYFIEQMDIRRFFGRACIVDACRDFGEQYRLTVQQLREWEAAHEPIQAQDMVFIRFGMDRKYALAPDHQDFIQRWGGVSPEAAQYLADKGISVVGTDALSIDIYGNPNSAAHQIFLGNEIYVIENLVNLDQLPSVVSVVALPLKLKGGSGAPVRVVALVEKKKS